MMINDLLSIFRRPAQIEQSADALALAETLAYLGRTPLVPRAVLLGRRHERAMLADALRAHCVGTDDADTRRIASRCLFFRWLWSGCDRRSVVDDGLLLGFRTGLDPVRLRYFGAARDRGLFDEWAV